jgi:hypothetical protein
MKQSNKPVQLRLLDIRHICDRCTDLFEQECGYRGCWMGWHIDGKQHPEKALCKTQKGGQPPTAKASGLAPNPAPKGLRLGLQS